MRVIKAILWLCAITAICLLLRVSYTSGRYVGMIETRSQAIEHFCGYVDQNGFHWRKPIAVDPSYYEIDTSGRYKPLMY